MNPEADMRTTAITATGAMMGMATSEGFSDEQKTTKKYSDHIDKASENRSTTIHLFISTYCTHIHLMNYSHWFENKTKQNDKFQTEIKAKAT